MCICTYVHTHTHVYIRLHCCIVNNGSSVCSIHLLTKNLATRFTNKKCAPVFYRCNSCSVAQLYYHYSHHHYQHLYLTTHNTIKIHSCPRLDSNPHSHKANDRRPTPQTALPPGSAMMMMMMMKIIIIIIIIIITYCIRNFQPSERASVSCSQQFKLRTLYEPNSLLWYSL